MRGGRGNPPGPRPPPSNQNLESPSGIHTQRKPDHPSPHRQGTHLGPSARVPSGWPLSGVQRLGYRQNRPHLQVSWKGWLQERALPPFACQGQGRQARALAALDRYSLGRQARPLPEVEGQSGHPAPQDRPEPQGAQGASAAQGVQAERHCIGHVPERSRVIPLVILLVVIILIIVIIKAVL